MSEAACLGGAAGLSIAAVPSTESRVCGQVIEVPGRRVTLAPRPPGRSHAPVTGLTGGYFQTFSAKRSRQKGSTQVGKASSPQQLAREICRECGP